MAIRPDIETRVAALGDLSRDELVALWRKNFGTPPPKGVHKDLLIRAAAFHLQHKHIGGLSGETKRLLKAAMRDGAKTRISNNHAAPAKRETASPHVERRTILSGARLIREWNGSNYVVDVVDGGFIYAGSRYRSLSKIAREITGTNWSGPRFFGL